jgi:hypothetical protein
MRCLQYLPLKLSVIYNLYRGSQLLLLGHFEVTEQDPSTAILG